MAGAWRYTTNPITCVREWFWYAVVGPAEKVIGAIPVCVRAGGVTLPLAVLVPAALPSLPSLSWGGLGPNAHDITSYSTPGGGDDGYGYAGLVPPGLAGGYGGPSFGGGYPDRGRGPPGRDGDGLAPDGLDLAPPGPGPVSGLTPDLVPRAPGPGLSFERPDVPGVVPVVFAPDVEPQPVPEPSSIVAMVAAVIAMTYLRRKATGRGVRPVQPHASNTEMTHA